MEEKYENAIARWQYLSGDICQRIKRQISKRIDFER